MEDYEVVQACLQGKKEMFEILVSRYKNLVYSIILRMTNDAEEANDLAQEVFIKVYRNLDKYQPGYKFSTWIMKISGLFPVSSCLARGLPYFMLSI